MKNFTDNVIISNPDELERKKQAIKQDGTGRLHILSDFDRTLTKAFVNGKNVPSLISVLRDNDYITEEYSKKAKALAERYRPIEDDISIPIEEKKKAMMEWWIKHFELLIESGLNKEHLQKIVDSGIVRFRQGVSEFLDFLKNNEIPLIIISSSGLGGDSISMFLKKHEKLYKNLHIISNFFEWDDNGKIVSFKKPVIHSFNKDETAIPENIKEIIAEKKNIILLGDTLGDIKMVGNFDCNILIKIGFLNDNPENLEEYKKAYDVVITNDGSFDYVNKLIKEIIK